MRRGTTPTIIISTDIDLSTASNLFITFKQHGRIRFEKTLEDVEVTENSVSVWLDQSETLSLSEDCPVHFQIRATLGDQKVASNIMSTNVDAILKGGEI